MGAGVAPTALQKHGISTTIVEIDPAVYSAARTYFGLPDPGEGKVFLEDARGWVIKRRDSIETVKEGLDIVIHDCFSGGGVPAHLFTLEFWEELKSVIKPDGIVAIVSCCMPYKFYVTLTICHFEEFCWKAGFQGIPCCSVYSVDCLRTVQGILRLSRGAS